MKWGRNLIVSLIVGTVGLVSLTLWQIAADTPPPVHLPVPKVQVVRVPVPGPGMTVVNRYLPVPAVPAAQHSLGSESAPTVNHPAPTTTASHVSPATSPAAPPKPAPCLTVPIVGCLP